MTNKHSIQELYEWQALPLNVKILMTKRRIRDWVNYYGIDGVYVSFSGGKDSTVLLHMAREIFPDIKACFIDTGLEYPEIRQFIKTFDNVDIVKPRIGFKKVCEKYGFPLISKEVSERVYYAQKYLTWYMEQNSLERTNEPSDYGLCDLLGLRNHATRTQTERRKRVENIPSDVIQELIETGGKGTYKLRELYGAIDNNGKPSQFNYTKYRYLATAPFYVSNKCCDVMKKSPAKKYHKKTGRVPITAEMASESRLRAQNWLRHGCNMYEGKKQVSKPMSFWTEQDVLLYAKTYNVSLASVYGDIVTDFQAMGQLDGQMSIADYMTAAEKEEFELDRPLLKTTGCKRTGCILCGFGCHLEKGESRFERLKKTHPSAYKALDVVQNNGVTYRQAIDWINEHNGKGKIIRY